jgi:hypothetical protein
MISARCRVTEKSGTCLLCHNDISGRRREKHVEHHGIAQMHCRALKKAATIVNG